MFQDASLPFGNRSSASCSKAKEDINWFVV